MKIINDINKSKEIRKLYYDVSREYLDILLGNELSMQLRVNLSVQLPKDNSSLLLYTQMYGQETLLLKLLFGYLWLTVMELRQCTFYHQKNIIKLSQRLWLVKIYQVKKFLKKLKRI